MLVARSRKFNHYQSKHYYLSKRKRCNKQRRQCISTITDIGVENCSVEQSNFHQSQRYLSSSDCNKQRKQTIFGSILANNIGAINWTGIADIIGVEEVQDLELNMEMFLRREGEPIYLFYF